MAGLFNSNAAFLNGSRDPRASETMNSGLANPGFGDFDLFLPKQFLDVNGAFLEEQMASSNDGDVKPDLSGTDKDLMGGWENASADGGSLTGPSRTTSEQDGDGSEKDKKAKRRKQIAAASRASRARRKRELEDLRDENKRLREERSQFLSKIGELQMKVENMRERGSTDMRVENELLRAQLEEHKRFVACFQRLCDGAPTSLNARHTIYKQGSDSAQAHVLGLISQSQADGWLEASVPDDIDVPFQNFSMFYKFKADFGENGSEPGANVRQRLNVRVDVLFPGLDCNLVSDFFWNSFSNTNMQQRLYGIKGIELTQLADDMPDKDTKMVYYREKWEAPRKDQDWVLICNRRRRELAKSTLALPSRVRSSKPEVGKVAAMVLAMTTTQHSVAPQFDNANRITSMFVQGAVTWNQGGDARLCVSFSFPDDFKVKAMEGFHDVINPNGSITAKFAEVVGEFNEMLGEHNGPGFSMP